MSEESKKKSQAQLENLWTDRNKTHLFKVMELRKQNWKENTYV